MTPSFPGRRVRIGANQFLLFRVRKSESGACFGIVLFHLSDETFYKARTVFYHLVTKTSFAARR